MKITKIARFLLIAVAAVMVFSLFACTEAPEEKETTTEEVKEPVESTGDKTPDEPENTESSDIAGGETTESKAPETAETEPKETEPKETEPKETEPRETEPKEPACEHANAQSVEAKDPTCTEDGNPAYKACAACGKYVLADGTLLDAAPVTPAIEHDWDDGAVTVPATCTEKGIKTYTCKFGCGETKTEEIAVNAENHVGDTFIAKETLEKKCSDCNAIIEKYPAEVFGANGFNAYFGPEYIAQFTAITQGVLSEDNNSVRFYGNGETIEGYINIMLNANNEKALGRYLIVKYNAGHMTSGNYNMFQFYAGTTETDASKAGNATYTYSKNDGWNIMVFDLAKCAKYTANDAGEYVAKLIRMDIINPIVATNEKLPADQYVEIAFIAVADSPEKCAAYIAENEADKEFCAHDVKVINVDTCESVCFFCNKNFGASHAVEETYVDNGNVRTVVGTCKNCTSEIYKYDATFGDNKPLYYLTASQIAAKAAKGNNIGGATLSADGTYVTVVNKKNAGDGYFSLASGDVLTGQYVMVKYRTTNADNFEWYTKSSGKGWGSNFFIIPIKDGEWQTIIIDLSKTNNASWVQSADGKYYANDVRWDIMNAATTEDRSVDIAFAAMSDNLADLVAINGTDAYYLFENFSSSRTGSHKPESAVLDNPFYNPSYLVYKAGNAAKAKLMKDEQTGLVYVKYIASAAEKEERFTIWNNTGVTTPNSGNYLVYVYRRPVGSPPDNVDVFGNSTAAGPSGNGDSNTAPHYVADGNWHIVIVDFTDNMDTSKADYYDPKTGITSLSIDWFNGGGRTPGETCVDVAYVGMFDDREQALKYYAAFLEKYGYECPHDSTSNTYATDNDDSTSYALVSSVCDLCGKQLELSKAPAVNNIANVEGYIHGANPGTYTTPYVFGPGSSKYPEAGYMTPGAGKTVALSGWGGAIGSVTKTAYRVLDADGNEVIGWTVYNNVDLNPSDISGIKGQVAGLVPDYGSAFRFNITADLSSLYTAENYGEMFTVEFAYIADDAEGNDKYLVCGIFENVMIPDPEA